jgi:hypothetical protein
MATIKQIDANRRNALQSTGPKTAEGKAAVALNAMKHGLPSRELLLPGENGAAFAELAENLRAQVAPVGALKGLFVGRIIGCLAISSPDASGNWPVCLSSLSNPCRLGSDGSATVYSN